MGTRILKAQRHGSVHLPAELVDATTEARRVLDAARSEANAIRERARIEGLEAAREAGRAEIAGALIAHAREQQATLDALEPKAVRVALEAAQRLAGRELSTHPDALAALVGQLLRRVRLAAQVTVRVHPEDHAGLASQLARAQDSVGVSALRLEADASLARGDCTIDSDVGSIDARLATRVAALARALEVG